MFHHKIKNLKYHQKRFATPHIIIQQIISNSVSCKITSKAKTPLWKRRKVDVDVIDDKDDVDDNDDIRIDCQSDNKTTTLHVHHGFFKIIFFFTFLCRQMLN